MTENPGHDCHWSTTLFITSDRDRIGFTYCNPGRHLMAASKSKVILFGNAKHDRKTLQWPIAVFNDAKQAKSYATFLRLAYRAADWDAVKTLDPSAHLTEEGTPLKDTKWSLVEVPYAPSPDLEDDDAATEEAAPTA
jgi:hypothetical protein